MNICFGILIIKLNIYCEVFFDSNDFKMPPRRNVNVSNTLMLTHCSVASQQSLLHPAIDPFSWSVNLHVA